MFYRPEDGHGLPHNPFNAVVSPRPIGWISTRDSKGRENLAPYSFFNAIAYVPPQVMFASTGTKPDRDGTKDSVAIIRETGFFCVNIVAYAMREAMNQTSGAWGAEVDEFAHAGIAREECRAIPCSRVRDAPAALECRLVRIEKLLGEANYVTFGEVVGVHLSDDCIVGGRFDVTRYQPLARLGYRDYTHVTEVFAMDRPGQ